MLWSGADKTARAAAGKNQMDHEDYSAKYEARERPLS